MRRNLDHTQTTAAPTPVVPPPAVPSKDQPAGVASSVVATPGERSAARRACRAVNHALIGVEGPIHRWLVSHSIDALRVSLGLVFVAFGALKFFPGVSPAADLAVTTTQLLTFGVVGTVVPTWVGLIGIATLECVIGLSLLTKVALRLTMYLLIVQLIGILSPIVLLAPRLFAGPFHAPTLEGQYVLKDIVLVGAAMVIATTFRGARIRYPHGGDPLS